MWKALLLACISISGCHAILETCAAARCEKIAPPVDVHNPDHFFASVERLQAICPAILATFDCLLKGFNDCANEEIEELSAADNETLAATSSIILGTKGLMEDLCDTTTHIHQAYARSIGCIRDTLVVPMVVPLCAFEAKGHYGAYKSGEDEDEREKSCLVASHTLACVSEHVLGKCGEEARATLVELVKRTKFLKHSICTPQHIADLKTKYIDYLALESARRSVFEKVFDMRRRK